MPRWVIVAQIVVEAETPDGATALVEAEFAARFPASDDWHQGGGETPRYTVASTQRLPDDPGVPQRRED